MAATDKDIPPIPKPTRAQAAPKAPAVPPVEAAPAVATAPATPPPPPVYAPPPPPQYGYAAPGAAPTYAAQPGYPVAYATGAPQGLAIASMILGIAGILFGFALSIAAIITGHLAQRRNPQARGFWITGLITGYAGIVLWGLFWLFFILIIIVSATTADQYGNF